MPAGRMMYLDEVVFEMDIRLSTLCAILDNNLVN
jgi:hypothetical protein